MNPWEMDWTNNSTGQAQQPTSTEKMPWEMDWSPQAQPPSVAADVAKTVVPGLVRGTAGLAGMPGDLQHMHTSIWDKGLLALTHGFQDVTGLGPQKGTPEREQWDRAFGAASPGGLPAAVGAQPGSEAEKAFNQEPLAKVAANERFLPGGGDIVGAIEVVTGPMYKPQTTAGKYVNTLAEFVPNMALAGSGGFIRNATTNVVAPAVASEAAGQFAAGTPWEMPARIAAAVTGGVGSSMALRPKGFMGRDAVEAVQGVTDDQFKQADAIMQEGQRLGAPVTVAESIAQATDGATTLPAIQSFVEGSAGGGQIMRQFMAQRPAQVGRAADQFFSTIHPQSIPSSELAPAIRGAAQDTLDATRNQINAKTAPLYRAAEAQRIPDDQYAVLMNDPAFQAGLKDATAGKFSGPIVQNMDPQSIGALDAVKKKLNTAAENLGNKKNVESRDLYEASLARQGAERVTEVAKQASPEYAQALDIQKSLREKYLTPWENGLLGQLAKKNQTVKQALDVLFPADPIHGNAAEVGRTVSKIAETNPSAAKSLVRAHARYVFDKTARDLEGGANEWGGAKFISRLVGNRAQEESFRAAVKALPDGEQILNGFDNLQQVFEATGRRQHVGSPTASRTEMANRMSQGGVIDDVTTAAKSGLTTIPGRVNEAMKNMRLKRDSAKLAKLLTDPEGVKHLKRLAEIAPDTGEAIRRTLRLMYIAEVVGGRK